MNRELGKTGSRRATNGAVMSQGEWRDAVARALGPRRARDLLYLEGGVASFGIWRTSNPLLPILP